MEYGILLWSMVRSKIMKIRDRKKNEEMRVCECVWRERGEERGERK